MNKCWIIAGVVSLSGCQSLTHVTSSRPAAENGAQTGADVGDALVKDFLAHRDQPGTMVYVGDHWIMDYRPRPSLVVETHQPRKARFPAVDVHCHWKEDQDPRKMIRAMDERGVRTAVNLSGDWGEKLDRMLERFHKFAPDRFVIFCSPDFSRIDEPDFDRTMAAFIAEAHAKGAKGVKIYKNLGLTVRDKSGRIVPVDDPRLDPIWTQAGALQMPVLIHTSDPAAFFEPIDHWNERWMQLRRHPNWSFHGAQFPSRGELLAQRNRMMARHPQTVFIGAHVGNCAEDLKSVAAVLEKHPNFNVDISGRVAEFGRQPYTTRRFFLKFQDRILFGTDRYPGRPDQPRYRIYYRFLETADEYFDYYHHPFPPTGEWKIYGIFLPDEVLEKVYHLNADRILGRGGKGDERGDAN